MDTERMDTERMDTEGVCNILRDMYTNEPCIVLKVLPLSATPVLYIFLVRGN